jgi:DNA-binding response OmpR family regulator/Tfp pilus assembly protein PilZ
MEPRILIVDDDALIRRIMRDTLATLPATVIEAKNGEEAVKTAKTEQPDLIFLDTMMPGMDGFQVAEALKQDAKTLDIPLVFVSALGTSTHQVRGLDLGAEDYLSKPIDPEVLKARTRSILRRTRPAPAAPEPVAAVAKGLLQNMALPSLIRWLEMERRGAQVHLTRGEIEGEILLQDGQITHALQGESRGDAAFYRLLGWSEGAFNITPPSVIPAPAAAVSRANDALLEEGARRLTELPGLRAALPAGDALLEVPVALRAALEADLPPAGVAVVDLLDGTRGLDALLDASPLDPWGTLQVIHRLIRVGALGWSSPSGAVPVRRSIPRVPMHGQLQYRLLQPAREADRFTLSARGVFVQTPAPAQVGDQVLLQLQFPGSVARITAVGQVIWRSGEAGPAKPEEAGMGLQFLEAAPETLEVIEQQLTRGIAAEVRQVMEEI